MSKLELGGIPVGLDQKPFVIAEMSGNHNQSIDRAFEIVEVAAKAGVHALKLQTYTADTMTLNLDTADFRIEDHNSLWAGRTLYELYEEAHTPWEWHRPIMEKAKGLGIVCFSTPFDSSAVDFLEDLDVPAYKIASFENTDLPLIRRVAATGKPIIISIGMATLAELDETVRTLRDCGHKDFVLLKCTSTYPASPENSNVLTIPHMREMFGCEVGLSDHTMGVGTAVAAVAHGATVVEKHFTLNRADGGVDAAFSLEPGELGQLVTETERAWKSLGRVQYGPTPAEISSIQFRRSIFVVRDMKAGDEFTDKNVRIIRPGMGLAPKYLAKILGRAASIDLEKGMPIKWEYVQ